MFGIISMLKPDTACAYIPREVEFVGTIKKVRQTLYSKPHHLG